MHIVIIGASGFIGSELTRQLLAETDHTMTLFSHHASDLMYTKDQEKRLRHIDGSVLTALDCGRALTGADMAVYLVHLMGQSGDYNEREAQAAETFGEAASRHGIKRVVYVGGMAASDTVTDLPGHLNSRQSTGVVLRKHVKQLIELRTPMVIGRGGAGYDVLRAIVDHSPILPLPTWARGVTRPITVGDVARYVRASLELKQTGHLSVAIGGPERLSYADVARRYATKRGRRLVVIPVPFIPQRAVSKLLRHSRRAGMNVIADALASASHSTVENDRNTPIFQYKPRGIDDSL